MPDITVHEAFERLRTAQVVDVREDHEVAQGRIPGSLHIPLGQLGERLSELDRHRPVVAVCRSGNRSGTATRLLTSVGYTCDNMAGGMLAWQSAGLPTV
ncbi:MAG TPA: rhodanese-like domain-containing protein [Propionibacteriaceae bacterium]|nr:rhodanese-like domain-containing protein [Propionibacteriaceae bacterium]